jgi:hypothetical protein
MKSKTIGWTLRTIAVLALAVASGALAQAPKNAEFHGAINDFTPATGLISAGPWEVRGNWSLTVKVRSGKADFSAALTMERSDLGVTENAGSPPPTTNPLDNPMIRMAHTHHFTLVNGEVTRVANGFEVTGPVTITKDGSWPPPFGGAPSSMTITISGGTGENSVAFSNITLQLGSPADTHFGSTLHGVVRGWDTADADKQR